MKSLAPLSLALLCAGGFFPDAARATPPSPVDALSQEETDRALDAIWRKTPDPAGRSPESAKRAALEAYLRRLGPGTGLFPSAPEEETEATFPPLKLHSEVLPGKVAYVRLGKLSAGSPDQLEALLRDFIQLGVPNLILDLRATPPSGSLADAAALASCFLPANTPLFSLRSSHATSAPLLANRAFSARFRLLVLLGPRTAGSVEAFAALLQSKAAATLLGSSTQGQAADFELVPLAEGRILRIPSSHAVLEGAPGLFGKGLRPDIPLKVSGEATDAALLHAAKEGRIAPMLSETERPRFNEAALVSGKNPETEAWIQNQLSKKAPEPAPPKDAVLRLAMDFLIAWDALHGQRTPLP